MIGLKCSVLVVQVAQHATGQLLALAVCSPATSAVGHNLVTITSEARPLASMTALTRTPTSVSALTAACGMSPVES